jgi:hypothetical protein
LDSLRGGTLLEQGGPVYDHRHRLRGLLLQRAAYA